MQVVILFYIAGRSIVDRNVNFEVSMCSPTMMEKKSSNIRRSNTMSHIAICVNHSSNGVADVCLSTT